MAKEPLLKIKDEESKFTLSIWEGVHQQGKYYSIDISKSYKDKNGAWVKTNTIFANEDGSSKQIEGFERLLARAKEFLKTKDAFSLVQKTEEVSPTLTSDDDIPF